MSDKRRFSRVNVPFETKLTDTGGACVTGELRDVAIQGAFIACAPEFVVGTVVEVDVTLHGGIEDVHVQARAEVVHQETDGLGIRFTAIDPESVGHLRNIITYNAQDADRILDEIYEGGAHH